MIKELQYTNIRRVLDNLTEHPLLRDLSLEQVVRYTIRFIGLHGFPKLYQNKTEHVDIKDFRGLLPCDLISIIQVKDLETGVCLRSMTDNFGEFRGVRSEKTGDRSYRGNAVSVSDSGILEDKEGKPRQDVLNNARLNPLHHRFKNITEAYIPPVRKFMEESSFKTQGRIIYVNFPIGCVEIAYKSIPVDDDGFPLLIDNENYLAALEAFIKLQVFTIKFDTGKINANVLRNAQQDYAWRAGELGSEFSTPSVSEMESITRMLNTAIVPMRAFDNGFINLGDREYLRKH